MEVVRFENHSGLLDSFLSLPQEVYRSDRNWIPPFERAIRQQLAADAPFHSHGRMAHFMAMEGGRPLARCSAILNDAYLAEDGVGLIGYFESLPNYAASEAILGEAVSWLKAKGAAVIRGPVNTSTHYPYRFMTDGFEADSFFLEPYNRPYYPDYWERFGFKPCQSYFSAMVDSRECATRLEREYSRAIAAGYHFRRFNLASFDVDLRLMHELSQAIFEGAFMARPLPFEQFHSLYSGMRSLLLPDLCQFLYQGTEPIGFVFGLPDLAPSIRAMRGDLGWPGKMRFLLTRERRRVALLKTFGVVPGKRNGSLALALCRIFHVEAARLGFTHSVHALMREDNTSLRMSRHRGGVVFKRYALFEYGRT